MATAVLDSNVLIAARLENDRHHDEASAIVAGVDGGDLPDGRVPRPVLVEVCNYLQVKAGHDVAVETLDAIQASVDLEIDRAPKTDFDAGRSLFRRYEGLSFADATIVAYMRRTGLEYLYSFDDDFDAVDDVARLDTASNPFG